MKKQIKKIKQSVNPIPNHPYTIVITRERAEYTFNHKDATKASEDFFELLIEESKYNSMIGETVVLGLYTSYDYNGKDIHECLYQVKIQGIVC